VVGGISSASSISSIALAAARVPSSWLTDRRQRRIRERSGLEVVEPHDGDLGPRLQASVADCLHGCERHQV
jgi:hypothetical protein